MQIHELTQPKKVNEGLWNTAKAVAQHAIGDYAGSMATSAAELQSRGRDIDSELDPKKSWEIKYAALPKDPGIKQYINQLTQEWLRSPDATTPVTPITRAAPGQMPASVANSKTGQDLQQMLGQPAGGIQGMQSDLEEAPEYTSPSGIVIPSGAKTDQPVTTNKPAPADYAGKFKAWVDKKLASRVTSTTDTVDMNQVRADIPDLATKLDAALKQVASTQNTPQNTVAIQEYLKLALAGTQAVAQYKRGESIRGRTGTATNELGVTAQQLRGLRALAQTPAGKQMLVKQLGL
jgi:hypothetical protein